MAVVRGGELRPRDPCVANAVTLSEYSHQPLHTTGHTYTQERKKTRFPRPGQGHCITVLWRPGVLEARSRLL